MNANSIKKNSRMTTTTPVGKKRKTDNEDDTSSSSKGLLSTVSSSFIVSSFPDIIWESIASFSSPPDVYNLALTSKYFHYTNNANDDDDDGSSSSPLLATRLLRKSLLSSFARVLDNSGTGIDINAALQLSSVVPKGQCVFAGSAMVQTCLGESWKGGDVDIYCLNEVAPQVRSWLVEKANSIFVGFKDYCISLDDERLTFTINTNIHHCEHYGSLKDNADYRGKDITEYYAETTKWGRDCHQTYVRQKWLRSIGLLGRDCDDAEYKIRPKKGGDLPFDFDENCQGNIDLIVGVKVPSDLHPSYLGKITAHDLLDSFDLTICKASFDGTTFKIPEPHLLFNRKSTMEPCRRTLLHSYMYHYGKVVNSGLYDLNSYCSVDKSLLASCVIDNVRRNLPGSDRFFNWVDIAKKIPDPSYDSDDSRGPGLGVLFSPQGEIKYGASIQFHNWICKLHHRLKKYQARGIEILDAPTIDDSIEIREFSLTGF